MRPYDVNKIAWKRESKSFERLSQANCLIGFVCSFLYSALILEESVGSSIVSRIYDVNLLTRTSRMTGVLIVGSF